MNSTLATLAVFLVAAMFLSQAQAQRHFDTRACCYDYVTNPIPQRNLKSYEYTNIRCPRPAVVFITHENQRICADINVAWAQDRIKHLDNN